MSGKKVIGTKAASKKAPEKRKLEEEETAEARKKLETINEDDNTNILPPVVVGEKPYFEIKKSCKGSNYEPSIFMPKLKDITKPVTSSLNLFATPPRGMPTQNPAYSQQSEGVWNEDSVSESGSQPPFFSTSRNDMTTAPLSVGLKAPISIVKVRKTAWLTLAAALTNYAEDLKVNSPPVGIYINKNEPIITLRFQFEGTKGKQPKTIDEQFDLNDLGKVFDGAEEDEEEDDNMSGGAKGPKGLTRKTMEDGNLAMKNVDVAMFKIISILFLLMNINSGQVSKNAQEIIQAFIATSSAKEYLDIGQLYAMCKPTIKLNEKRGYTEQQILDRCKIYFPNNGVSMGGMINGDDDATYLDPNFADNNASNFDNNASNFDNNASNFDNNASYNFDSDIDESQVLYDPSFFRQADVAEDVFYNYGNNVKYKYADTDEEYTDTEEEEEKEEEKAITMTQRVKQSEEIEDPKKEFAETYREDDDLVDPPIASTTVTMDVVTGVEAAPAAGVTDVEAAPADEPAMDVVTAVERRVPHKPMLESIDGAATSIAANQFFTSYCSCKLKGEGYGSSNEKDDATFVIDNNDVFLLTIWFSKDVTVIGELEKQQNLTADRDNVTRIFTEMEEKIAGLIREIEDLSRDIKTISGEIEDLSREIEALSEENEEDTVNDTLGQLTQNKDNKIERLKETENHKIDILKEIDKLTTQNTVKKIDICYYILKTYSVDLNVISRNISDKGTKALVIKKEYYDIFSVACFLYKYNSTPDIVKGLINCNFDPLCHDNKDSKIYRLIMVLIFILKNSKEDIKDNLKLMFPTYFVPNGGIVTDDWNQEQITTLNNTEVNGQKIFLEPGEEVVNDYYNYIDKCIFKYLLPEQQIFFKILAGNNYEKIQDKLYLRLAKKSCYVFQKNTDEFSNDLDKKERYVIIVPLQNSADEAYGEASRFEVSDLDRFVFLPKYTYCAIDAPLKHGLSLSRHNITSGSSRVYITAVTRNDAAAQKMPYSGKYLHPICIDIDVKHIPPQNNNAVGSSSDQYFKFTYKYYYGLPPTEVEPINVPDVMKNELKRLETEYKRIIRYLNEVKNNFYFGKRNTDDLKAQINRVKDCFLKVVNKISPSIRDALSRLIEKSINGTKKDSIIEGKAQFINFFIDYMSNEKVSLIDKEQLINYTDKLMVFVYQTDVNNLRTKIGIFLESHECPDNANANANVASLLAVNESGTANVTGTANVRGRRGRGRGGGVDTTYRLSVEKSEIPSKFQIETTNNVNNLAQGVGNPAPDERQDKMQYSYSTLFGKYGFDMAINEDGEYELHILDTEDQYNAYLRKYGLSEEEETGQEQEAVGQQQQVEQTEQQQGVAAGGKRKKTKKHKRVKYNTRRVPKVRLNKSKRKVVRKATKTRSKK